MTNVSDSLQVLFTKTEIVNNVSAKMKRSIFYKFSMSTETECKITKESPIKIIYMNNIPLNMDRFGFSRVESATRD